MPEPGTILDGRYRIDAKIGEGGMGVVYKAFDLELEKTIALKTLLPQVKDDPEAQRDLRSEVALSQELSHPCIVRVHHLETRTDVPYMTMELVDGVTLAQHKGEQEKLGLDEVLKIAGPLLEAVAYAHDRGVVHRDIKPQNIMLTRDGGIKIMDFGIAQALKDAYSKVTGQSSSGTPYYMSPEHIRGRPADVRSDIYSLGCTFYELLAGKPPFWTGDVIYQQINEQPKLLVGVPGAVNQVLLRCLAKDPSKRYQSVAELAADFLGKGLAKAAEAATIARPVGTAESPTVARPAGEVPARYSYGTSPRFAAKGRQAGGAAMKTFWILSSALAALIVIVLVILFANPFAAINLTPMIGGGGADGGWVNGGGYPGGGSNTSADEAVGVSLDEEIRGAANGTEERFYRFEADRAGWYEVFTDSSLDTRGELLDADENELCSDDNGGRRRNFKLECELEAGDYYVVVRGDDNDTFGPFTLTVRGMGCGRAGGISVGGAVAGSIDGHVPRYYRFDIASTRAYRIFTTGDVADTYGILHDQACEEITQNDDGGEGVNFQIERSLSPGTYYILVRGFSESSSGEFTLHVERTSMQCAGAQSISVGQGISGRCDGRMETYYRFDVGSAGNYSIFTSGSVDTYGRLLDEGCSSIETDDDGGEGPNFQLSRHLEPGTYYVSVRGYGDSTYGPYTLRVNPAGGDVGGTDCGSAGDISVGADVSVSLSGRVWRYFRFTVSSRGSYRIYTTGSTDSYGELLDSGCNAIVTNDDGGENLNFQIDRTLNAGTYYVRVRGFSDGASGITTLHLIR